jgi:hypothetical protein
VPHSDLLGEDHGAERATAKPGDGLEAARAGRTQDEGWALLLDTSFN